MLSVFTRWRPGSKLLEASHSRPTLILLFHTAPFSPRKQREEQEDERGKTRSKRIRNIHNKTKPSPHFVISNTTWCCRIMLKGTAHEGLLVLAIRQAGVSEGTRRGLSLRVPDSWASWSANVAAVGRPVRGGMMCC